MTTRMASALVLAAAVGAATTALAAQTKPAPSGTDRKYVVIGCLTAGGSGSARTFTITDTRGAKPMPYRLDGDQQTIGQHVGHYVEASGSLSGGATPTLKVASLVYISKT